MNDMIHFFKKLYFRYLWWFWQIIMILLSIFFLILGVQVLISAYKINDPFDFVLSFFASNLMILISFVLLIGFAYRIVGVYRLIAKKRQESKDCQNPPKLHIK